MKTRYYAGLTLAQARAVRILNKSYLSRLSQNDREGAFRSVAMVYNRLAPDVSSIIKAQQSQGWPTPILMALSRAIQTV